MAEEKKIAILGFARDAGPVLAFLKNSPEFKNADIWVLDKNKHIVLPEGVRGQLGDDYMADLSGFDMIVRTPGIPYVHPAIQAAKKEGTEITSATKIFFKEIDRLPLKPLVVGITGTKGKGTTATMLYNILRAAGRNVFLAGNIGKGMIELLPELARTGGAGERPIVILELSSFQLQDLDISPEIAVVLDIFPDHQDAHRNLEEYYGAKANIVRHQHARDRVFYTAGNTDTERVAHEGSGRKIAVDATSSDIFSPKDLLVPGRHNFVNAVMAATIARALGTDGHAIKKALSEFRGNPHRLEFVKTVSGVSFYNDSSSTIPQPTAAALRSFPGTNVVLIAGGHPKIDNYAPIAEALQGSGTVLAVLIGENKRRMWSALAGAGVPLTLADDLRGAVALAYAAAIKAAPATVVFSPGAASFDMFRDYADRGDKFKEIVNALK